MSLHLIIFNWLKFDFISNLLLLIVYVMGGTQSVEQTITYNGCYSVDEASYTWVIPKFRKELSNGVGHVLNSDVLKVNLGDDVDKYRLVIYPNGFNERVKGYVSVFLEKVSAKERLINFRCAILDVHGVAMFKKAKKRVMGIQPFLGWPTFCRRDALLEDDFEVLDDGNLLLKCSLQIFNDKALPNPESAHNEQVSITSITEFSRDVGNLFVEHSHYDFTLLVENEEFHVHKAILSARSPVFRVLLKSPLNNENLIEITDISKSTMMELLVFMYIGSVGDQLDFKKASDLYYAADKYEVTSLKNICSEVIKANLEVDNVLDAFLLSDKHSDLELKEVCVQFIVKNAQKVQEQKEWMELLENEPSLANLVFKRVVSNTKT